jgi:hypothetical protein
VSAQDPDVRITDRDSADLLLMVSNQSFLDDPVVLTIEIDGLEVLSRPFEVRNQHHYVHFPLRLGSGSHQLRATSDTGVSINESFTLPEDGARQYAGISYYNYADEDGMLIDWVIQSTPMGVK